MRNYLRQKIGLEENETEFSQSWKWTLLRSAFAMRRRYLNWSWQPNHDLDSALRYRAVERTLYGMGFTHQHNLLEVGGGANCLSAFTSLSGVVADVYFAPHVLHLPQVRKTYASVWHLPFSDVTFDAVICLDTIENLKPDRRGPAIREILRCSRKWVVFTIPCGAASLEVDQQVYALSEKLRPEDTLFHQFLAEHLEHGLPDADWIALTIKRQAQTTGRSVRISQLPHIDRQIVLAYWRYLLIPRLPFWGYWWGIAYHVLVPLLNKATLLRNPYRIIFAVEYGPKGELNSDGE